MLIRWSLSCRDADSLLHLNQHRRRTDSEGTVGSLGSCSTIPPVSRNAPADDMHNHTTQLVNFVTYFGGAIRASRAFSASPVKI